MEAPFPPFPDEAVTLVEALELGWAPPGVDAAADEYDIGPLPVVAERLPLSYGCTFATGFLEPLPPAPPSVAGLLPLPASDDVGGVLAALWPTIGPSGPAGPPADAVRFTGGAKFTPPGPVCC